MFVNPQPHYIATTPVDIFLVQETEINGDRPNDLNQNTDELFERIFNRPRPTGLQRIIVPLFINDQPQGEIVVFVALGDEDNLEIVATTLLSRIREYVRPDVQEALEQLVGDSGNLTINGIQSTGIDGFFDGQQLQLRLQIPPNLRRTIVYGSGNQNLPPGAENAIRPASLSGFVNLRGRQSYLWSGSGNLGREAFGLGIDGAINYRGWVLEGSGTYSEGATPSFIRSDIRLVRDDPNNGIRYVMGDLFSFTRGYQSFVPMGGIAMVRNFSLQPYLVTVPTGQFEFFLDRPSTVEIFVNGLLRQTLQLPAGTQDIRNFALNTGHNNITLQITDDVGQVRNLSFSAPLASDLLAVGLSQFGVGVGVPSFSEEGTRNYDMSRPIATGFYRQGIAPNLTLGAYFQGANVQQLFGSEGVLATNLGNFGWDMALSNNPVGVDHSFRLRYQYLPLTTAGRRAPNFGFNVEYQGPFFQRFGNLSIGNPDNVFSDSVNMVAWNLGVNYGQRLTDNLGVNFNVGYQIGSLDNPDGYRGAIALNTRLSSNMSLNVSLSHRRQQSGEDDTQLRINLLQSGRNQSISARNTLTTEGEGTTEVRWNRRNPNTFNSINSNLTLNLNPQPRSFGSRLGLDYRTFFGSLNFAHDYNQSQQRSNLNFDTAFVFAGGRVGWTRPVTDSFVIIARNDNFSNQSIVVNPSTRGHIAEAGIFGPAVVPTLSSYSLSNIRIDALDLPLGFDLGESAFTLYPTYRSGSVIVVGTDATVFVRGTLQDGEGNPIALQAGEVISLSNPDFEPLTLFTNQVGRFALMGLTPGSYRLNLFTNPRLSTEFTIPANETGVFDLGIIRFGS
ncbi:fimbria/pilus outer membrane usher protein [Cyanobacterium sp. IPPAS B-1200]|uniref:fimbria/pilus outer membrane usher protein n=1 Tax=Cyanobacterium sp. IPPAS B-1200 TaxID=1562720 RepID=UPI0008525261|nr:fimbria/pilus outer membrane usher protein [Cyanobacterium sp. IPPAS B-1200]OEJ78760.1 fimbrial biogenesis outer membrane usher protein [Cyanobacterium sp. IPPAS B-1200]